MLGARNIPLTAGYAHCLCYVNSCNLDPTRSQGDQIKKREEVADLGDRPYFSRRPAPITEKREYWLLMTVAIMVERSDRLAFRHALILITTLKDSSSVYAKPDSRVSGSHSSQ